jgi:hypothetical protein
VIFLLTVIFVILLANLKKLKTLHTAKWWRENELATLKRELPELKL